jgi:hypothetical protein
MLDGDTAAQGFDALKIAVRNRFAMALSSGV